MLSGIKEIVIIVLVLLALFLIPRFLRRGGAPESRSSGSGAGMPKNRGLFRLGILLSVLWIALAFVLLNPMQGNAVPFLGAGVLPVGLAWGVRWVVLGFRK